KLLLLIIIKISLADHFKHQPCQNLDSTSSAPVKPVSKKRVHLQNCHATKKQVHLQNCHATKKPVHFQNCHATNKRVNLQNSCCQKHLLQNKTRIKKQRNNKLYLCVVLIHFLIWASL
ncbi:unnamed protein product, partial [Candidula unifasciata]